MPWAEGKFSAYVPRLAARIDVFDRNGKYGLWIDESLLYGKSQNCATFDNDPLSATEEFDCSHVELWRLNR